ncbi:MAG: CocE/NonD family hydrolase [Gammaproteobacteria bacterium]
MPEEEATQIARAASRDELNDEFAWFDEHLMDITPGPSTRARTSLYITGVYQWFEFDDWPPTETHSTPYYLVVDEHDRNGHLQRVAADGISNCSSYRFDPDQPTPFWAKETVLDRSPFDNASLEQQRNDMLLFDTPVVEEPLALVGELSVMLYASADVADFDLYAKLLDVYPDGRAIFLTDGIMRARFREGWQQPDQVKPGDIQPYLVELWHLGHVLRTGHMLRLEIASSALGRFDVNPCTGTNLATETRCQIANVTIQHNVTYPSHLILPVYHDDRLSNGGL